MPGRLADKVSDSAALLQRQGRKAAPASSLSAHSEFAMEASHRLMADDRAHLRTDGGAGADAQASAQLQSASASGLRLRKVTALHQGSAGADKPVVSIDGGTEAAPQVEVAGGDAAAVSAGGRGPQAPPSATSAHDATAAAAEAASRHSRRLGDKKAAAKAAARAAAAAERAAGSALASDWQNRRRRAAALARGRQARAARREQAAERPGTEHPAVPTAASGTAKRNQAAAALRAAVKAPRTAKAPRAAAAPSAAAKAPRAATGATSQRRRRRKAAAGPGAHGEADDARRLGGRAAAPANGTPGGKVVTEGARAGGSVAAANAQLGGSDGTGAVHTGANPRTLKPQRGGGSGRAVATSGSAQATVRYTKGTSAGTARTPPQLGKGMRVRKAPEVYTPLPTPLVAAAGCRRGATGKRKAAAADSGGPSKRQRRVGTVQGKHGEASTEEWADCPCSDYVPVVMKADAKTADLRNNLHAAWRVGQTQKYDKMALQQAELQAVLRRGPVTARQQQMQEKAARKIDTLRGLSKDYALLDARKQVANSCRGVRECVKVCQHADGARPLTCNPDDEVDADEINCGLCDVRESTDDNDIVCCDGPCNSAYHVRCQRPHVTQEELDEVGDGRWLCRACSAKAEVIALLNEEYEFEYMEYVDWEDVLRGDMQDWHTKAEARPTTDRTPLADNSSQDSDGDSAMEEALAGDCPAGSEVDDEPWGNGASEGDSTSDDDSASGADAASEPESADSADAPADMQME